MDKYLDLAEKNMGRPKFVAFIAWELYLAASRGKGPAVTALDPATGKLSTIYLPRFEDPNSKAIWKPIFDELHKRMAKRGLEKTMLLGLPSDIWPNKEEIAALEEASGNLPWINHTHGGNYGRGLATVAYKAFRLGRPVRSSSSRSRHGQAQGTHHRALVRLEEA